MAFCTDFSLLSSDGSQTTAIPLYCKRWTCQICKPRRRWQLIKDALRGKPNTFLTLTVNPKWFSGPKARARRLVEAFREIRRLAIKEASRDLKKRPWPYGYARPSRERLKTMKPIQRQVRLENGKFPFLAVFEKTQQGEPHLHVLARTRWIEQRWLARLMGGIMGAPVCDVRRVENKRQMARYCSKYVGKAAHQFGTLKRYWRALDWLLDRKKKEKQPPPWEGGWYRWKGTLDELKWWASNMGLSVKETRQGLLLEGGQWWFIDPGDFFR